MLCIRWQWRRQITSDNLTTEVVLLLGKQLMKELPLWFKGVMM